ncbi:MAG: hypothetical protein RL095_2871 [Verrucomicrobiota bacterium]|jgi:Mg-chelatase subunit ChlD
MPDPSELSRRWRLILGAGDANLSKNDLRMDQCLGQLYQCGDDKEGEGKGKPKSRQGGLGGSSPNVQRWLGDIREFFPSPSVHLMQKDAMDRLGLKQLLLEPEVLRSVEPDVELAATLISLSKVIPEKTRATARQVVRKITDDLIKQLQQPFLQAVRGALRSSARTRKPRAADIDWHRTIRANLRHYLPEHQAIIPQTLIGHSRAQRASLRDVILLVDQSGSMASSVVYSAIFAAVLCSVPAVRTRYTVFDTAVVELTETVKDPVDLLFSTQLGGGTDIHKALSWATKEIQRPADTILVLITDLYEGGDAKEMIKRAAALKAQGVHLICLLALDDSGKPSYDPENARAFQALDIPVFACTPQLFPALMAAAIQKRDIHAWAAQHAPQLLPEK